MRRYGVMEDGVREVWGSRDEMMEVWGEGGRG